MGDGCDRPGKAVLSCASTETPLTAASQSPAIRVKTTRQVRRSRWPVPGGDLHAEVVEVGAGVPIVFLHGLVGLNEHWEQVVERVCDRVRCVLFELPLLQLRGEHCCVQGVGGLTAQFLSEYMDEPAVLAGNSFGGHVATRIGLDYPELTRGLILAGASGLIEKSMVSDVQIRPSREWLSRKMGELFYNPAEHMREADLERAHRELSDRGNARAMVKLSRSARRDHLGARMPQMQMPVLLIWGKQDIVTPPEAAEQFERLIPDTRIVWFDDCGHVPMVECADAFAEALLRFADELSGGGSPAGDGGIAGGASGNGAHNGRGHGHGADGRNGRA